jgi:hypothetical protein
VSSQAAKTHPEEGAFFSIFFGLDNQRFFRGFWQKRVAERGFLMVNLWWIAGESWCVDGHFSGSKNMPLFPDLFSSDSHFGSRLPYRDTVT